VLFLVAAHVPLSVMVYRLGVEHVHAPLVHPLPVGRQLGETEVLLLRWSCIVLRLANSVLGLHFLIVAGALRGWLRQVRELVQGVRLILVETALQLRHVTCLLLRVVRVVVAVNRLGYCWHHLPN
jgi:hypothetical protein